MPTGGLWLISSDSGGRCTYPRGCSLTTLGDWNRLGRKNQSAQHGGNAMKSDEEDNPRVRFALLDQYKRRTKGILHLGAHLGQEAAAYADLNKPVVWVEALPNLHSRLANHVKQFPGQRAMCALLGDRNGIQKTFYISNNAEGASSSVFQFGDYGGGDKSLWPELKLAMVDSITLPMLRLDTLLQGNGIDAQQYDFWVVDLQGAELLALQGSGDLLQYCRALYVEVSTVPVYQGGVLWPELSAWLGQAGFVPLWQPGKRHDDVLFVREEETRQTRSAFHSDNYMRHNQRRLEHLASLHLALRGKSVLEVGAGIGDHTGFYLDRGCSVLSTEIRPENLALIRERYSGKQRLKIRQLDMDNPASLGTMFDIVHCYGLLYHLQNPAQALCYLAEHCSEVLLLESCVSYGEEPEIRPLNEPSQDYTQAFYGIGCRPTRIWIWNQLRTLFPHVYAPRTQPSHEEFPVDWTEKPACVTKLYRSVFVASRYDLASNKMLLPELPSQYSSHE